MSESASDLPEIVMPLHPRDLESAVRTVRHLQAQYTIGRIVILCPADACGATKSVLSECDVVDEATIVDGLSHSVLDSTLSTAGKRGIRATGWIFQQLLKLGYARKATSQDYVVWDADTVPLKAIPLIDQESERIILYTKAGSYAPYLLMNRKVLGLEDQGDATTFIAEFMYMRSRLVSQMLDEIEARSGAPFWLSIVNSLDHDAVISEFEMVGNWIAARHASEYEARPANSLRFAGKLVGTHPTDAQMKWLSKSFDAVTLESYHDQRLLPTITRSRLLQQLIPAHLLCRSINWMVAPLVKNSWTDSKYFYF